jgi:alkylation response protein AidB-like acyl-CoA dehydrogenase
MTTTTSTPTTATAGMEPVETFRARARTWLAANMQRGVAQRHAVDDQTWSTQQRALQARVHAGGFAGISYPIEYGGLGLSRAHQRAFKEEAVGYVMPSQFSVTHGILGPTLLDFGTEEQKTQHIPAMLRGEEMWVQFLSEPSGGSDLAGLITRATRDGDTYILNGAKIWTTSAHFSDYAMALCRTDWDVPKHRGLSMFLVPIRHPGITVRPIALADRSTDFCQEFIDDAVLPATNLIGTENDGWTVASRLLYHERNMTGGDSYDDTPRDSGDAGVVADQLVALAKEVGNSNDPLIRQKLGEAMVLEKLKPYTIARVSAAMQSGRMPGPGASLLKLMAALTNFRREEIAFEIAGPQAAAWTPGDGAGHAAVDFLRARVSTVAGGSNEMQRNQISERVLGLPREASPDKDVPFNQVRRNAPTPRR